MNYHIITNPDPAYTPDTSPTAPTTYLYTPYGRDVCISALCTITQSPACNSISCTTTTTITWLMTF